MSASIILAPGVRAHVGIERSGENVVMGLGIETPYGPYSLALTASEQTFKQTLLGLRRQWGPRLYDFVTAPGPRASVGAMAGGTLVTRASLGMRPFER